jgi:hypothetical protein
MLATVLSTLLHAQLRARPNSVSLLSRLSTISLQVPSALTVITVANQSQMNTTTAVSARRATSIYAKLVLTLVSPATETTTG